MIDLKHEQVEALLEKSIYGLNNDDFQLVSYTKRINTVNPFQFFEAAKQTEKNRIFWMSSNKEFYLVGIGCASEMMSEKSETRFNETKDKWNNVLNKAVIHNGYEVPGTGIVALGGMSFDPEKQTTTLWENYKASHFVIPEYMLTVYRDTCYLTVNVKVTKNDHPTQLANEIKDMESTLCHETIIEDEILSIINKEEIDALQWKETVRKATDEIKKASADKIVLAREMRLTFNRRANIGLILQNLLESQPNSYIFAFEQGEDCFVGATPERLVKLENARLFSTCLAGTAPRGKTPEEDSVIRYELLHDEKNLEEHQFVVQMIKAAMEDYCTDLKIPSEPVIYPLRNLQHLYTPVTGILKKGFSIFDIIEKLHPTPALGGSPKDKSLVFIRENEVLDRGWYGAPVGWMDSNNNGEFAVAIRSALVQGDEASLFAGCGVVKDSIPEQEYEETNMKFLPMLSVLGGQA
ncbi:isochorismate synthase [Oceanobacillus bengalensis]|uniref:Isochorismate synthase MenF n=1 Tax=Oceanobacillus bengalensis TaxID=1435466 RepID=A0A494YWB6_9BACI|nr:isochorismate synthase [Oceanobacillus bengalensis]RKQ14506.1 isochorismate synthase [Oceanobacillus bengalensis]